MIKKGMHENISNVCIKWQQSQQAPFFAEFLLKFRYKKDKSIKTIGVGLIGRVLYIFYSPEFIDKLSMSELEGVLVHEIMHILNKFNERLCSRDKNIFNIAQDACINDTIKETYIGGNLLSLPKDGVDLKEIKKMGYNGPAISESVYDFLYERADKIYITGDGESECPSCGGTGKNKSGKECKTCKGKKVLSTTDNHGKMKPLSEIEKQVLEKAVKDAKVRSYGTISGSLIDKIEALLKSKSIPWKQKLNILLSKYVNEPGNVYENTWSKRNRRNLPLPGVRKKMKRVVLTVDTSGSISSEDLQKFFGQIEKIVKDYSAIRLIEWDTKVQKVYDYRKGDWKKIAIHGRGGTCVQDLYNYVRKEEKRTSVIVNFTDGRFDWNVSHYNIPTIWAIIGNSNVKPTFGKMVIVEDKE